MTSWDWDTKEKVISNLKEWKEKFNSSEEILVSPDFEKIVAIVKVQEGKTFCINGETWNNTFERICFPQITPLGSVICLALRNYEWTLAKDDTVMEETFDYAWNLKTDKESKSIAFNIKKGDSYGVCLDGKIWDTLFFDARDLILSDDGKHAASYVRVENPPLLDIFSFKKGVWTIAADGNPWDKNFISIYGACFSPDNKKIAASVRLSQQEFTVAIDGKTWDEIFLNAWEPIFLDNDNVAVPVKREKGWTLAINGKVSWPYFTQLWHQRVSPDGRIAAVVATEFGKWTVALDGNPWKETFSHCVLPPFFSADGKKIGAVIRNRNTWSVAINGKPWDRGFDRIWSPQLSPDGNYCIAKAEKEGTYFLVLNGKIVKETFDMLWEPKFSPDGDKILFGCIKNGKYIRKVLSLSEVLK